MTAQSASIHPDTIDQLRRLFADVLGLGARAQKLEPATPLLGSLPELDSMAVATILVAIEDRFAFQIDDEDIGAELFSTFGSLAHYIDRQRSAPTA